MWCMIGLRTSILRLHCQTFITVQRHAKAWTKKYYTLKREATKVNKSKWEDAQRLPCVTAESSASEKGRKTGRCGTLQSLLCKGIKRTCFSISSSIDG